MKWLTWFAVFLACLCLCLGLGAPCAYAQEEPAQAQEAQAQEPTPNPAGPLDRLVEKIETLGAPLVALGILICAIVLMASPAKGKTALAFVLLGGFILLGGWRWLVDLIRYMLAP